MHDTVSKNSPVVLLKPCWFHSMQNNIYIKDKYDVSPAENTHSEGIDVIDKPLLLKLQGLEAALKDAKKVSNWRITHFLLPKSLHYIRNSLSSLY